MSNFKDLGLSAPVLEVLNALGFEQPTPIQEKSIPLLLEEEATDFIGLAQTGTGKTAAFGLPLIERVDLSDRATQALIMAPTRELGQQIAQQLKSFAKGNRDLNIEVVYGGAAIVNQIKALRKPTQIVVATPGRLLDLIERRAVHLDQIRYVVLDEADEMLNMGFKQDIDRILSYTPDDRVTWLFSATMPGEIRKIVNKYMNEPQEISIISEHKTNKDISHQYVVTKMSHKVPALRRFLDLQPEMRGIMFCRTKRETRNIADDLGAMGYSAEALHGDLSQAQRDAVMKRFKTRSMQLLVATDVAARGIDVDDLTHVIHHTLPEQIENYTHRSGRTGRAGRKGISIAFINSRESRKIKDLERRSKISFENIAVPSMEEIRTIRLDRWAEKLIDTNIGEDSHVIYENLQERFEELTKEQLIKRLITEQLAQLQGEEGVSGNLNDTSKGRDSDGRRSGKDGFNRYFVNIGSMDGLTKSDLIRFLSDHSDIPMKEFGDMNLQKSCAYFDVSDQHDQGISKAFTGLTIEGRDIRVNRDHGRRSAGGGSGGYNKRGGGGSGRGRFSKSGGGGFRKGGGSGKSSYPRKKRY